MEIPRIFVDLPRITIYIATVICRKYFAICGKFVANKETKTPKTACFRGIIDKTIISLRNKNAVL